MSGTAAWVSSVPTITNIVDAVEASVVNRSITALAQRTEYLLERLQVLGAGEALYYPDAPISSAVLVGQPVYFNADTAKFEPGLAALDYDDSGTWGRPAASCYCWGLLTEKLSAVSGTIVLAGAIQIDITNALASGEVPESGPYFLSARTAGQLEAVKSAGAPLVLYYKADTGTAVIQASWSRGLSEHEHYRIQLVAEPAGIPNNPDIGQKHSITTADDTLQGWLPASHASFQEFAPTGAKFGYNLSAHPELATVFPPLPLDTCHIEVYGAGLGSSRELGNAVKVDVHGIWWMDDDYGRAPWSVDYWKGDSGAPEQSGDSAVNPAPVDVQQLHGWYGEDGIYDLSIFLWFVRPSALTSDMAVASLVPATGSPITITTTSGASGSTGHLMLGLNFSATDDTQDASGYLVVKSFNGTTAERGPVVEGVRSSSSALQISGTTSTDGYSQGLLTLTYIDPHSSSRELEPLLIALDGAREEVARGIQFIGFPASRASGLTGRIRIPTAGFDSSLVYKMKLRLRVFGSVAGVLPELSMTYKHLPAGDPVAQIPESFTSLTAVDLGITSLSAYEYVDVDSDEFTVTLGSLVFYTLDRAIDSYTGTVGMLMQLALIYPEGTD